MQESRQNLSEDVLSRMKLRLQSAFGERLQGVILYGSEARHEAAADSDVDLLVLLIGPVDHGKDSWTCIRALYPLVLELERPIHAKPTDVLAYEAQQTLLYQDARREGIPV
jgi:predicted nucleotidyltransferase